MNDEADRELNDYLAGRHPLSAAYKHDSTERAPPELDAAILQSARAAVAPVRRRRPRWSVPLAAAATMVLGVSLVTQLRDEAVPPALMEQAAAPMAADIANEVEQRSVPAEIASAAPMMAEAEPQTAAPPPREMAARRAATEEAERAGAARQERAQAAQQRQAEAPYAAMAAAAPPPAPAETVPDRAAAKARAPSGAAEGFAVPSGAQLSRRALSSAPVVDHAMAADTMAAEVANGDEPLRAQADALLALLQSRDLASLREQFGASSTVLAVLEGSDPVWPDQVSWQAEAAGDRGWRIDYRDADDDLLCTAWLRHTAQGWQLVELLIER